MLPQQGGQSPQRAYPHGRRALGRADAVLAQALAGILTHPVGGPRRIQLQDDMYRLKAMVVHDRADLPSRCSVAGQPE